VGGSIDEPRREMVVRKNDKRSESMMLFGEKKCDRGHQVMALKKWRGGKTEKNWRATGKKTQKN